MEALALRKASGMRARSSSFTSHSLRAQCAPVNRARPLSAQKPVPDSFLLMSGLDTGIFLVYSVTCI